MPAPPSDWDEGCGRGGVSAPEELPEGRDDGGGHDDAQAVRGGDGDGHVAILASPARASRGYSDTTPSGLQGT